MGRSGAAPLRGRRNCARGAGLGLDVEAVAGAEGDGGERDYGMVGEEAEAELLGDGGEDERGFHEGEGVADALARAEAEGEVGEAGNFFEEVAFPAFGVEGFGGVIPARIAMDDPGNDGDAGAFGDWVTGESVVFDGEAGDGPGWGIEAHGFGKNVTCVGEMWEIVKSGSAAVEDGVEFGMEFFFDAGMLREEPPGPGESAGGCLVACEEKSAGFIAKLLRGHAGAVFILSMDEQGEEIAGVFVGLAALLDDAVDDLRELANGTAGLAIHFGGQPHGGHDEAAEVGGVLEQDVEVFADLRGVALDVGAKKRFADDLEGEAHHGLVKVDSLIRLPGFEDARGAGGHGGGVIGDAGAVKGGLHHAALAEPEVAFTGEKAVTENVSIGAEDAALDEFFGVVHEDVFDVVGVEEEEGADVEEAETDDVAILAGGTGHETERIPAERAAQAVEEALFGAGGIVGHGEMVRGNERKPKRGRGIDRGRLSRVVE
jgi:hypothetical protein